MRTLLSFAFIILTFSLTAQLEFTAEANASGPADEGRIDYTFTITNAGSEQAKFWWVLDVPVDVPRDWIIAICDSNVCHPDNILMPDCDDAGANYLDAGESITYYKVSIFNEDADMNPIPISPGIHDLVFRIIEDCAASPKVVVGEITITFDAMMTDGLEDLEFNDAVVLYPNPSTGKFQISEDQNVSSIAVFNTVGKNILNSSHRKGQSHDISHLEKGLYLIRMMDRANNTLQVRRMTIE